MPITINNFQLFFQRIVTGFRAYCGLQFIQCFFSFRKLYDCHRGIKAHSACTPSMPFNAFSTCMRQWLHIMPSTLNSFFMTFFVNGFTSLSGFAALPMAGLSAISIFFLFSRRLLVTTLTLLNADGSACYHGIQQETVDRVEHAGCDGYTYYVIDKCPKQILTNGAYGQLGEFQRFRYFGQVGRYDSHFGYIHAMSLPPPMAMLRSACARAALSLMPSPTIATFLPFFCKLPMKAAFSCGKTPAL